MKIPPRRTTRTQEMLTVTWNYKKRLTLIKIFLPHLIASTVASKLSSNKMMSEFYLAALTPDPMARPILAVSRASTSVIPSPVQPTFL